MQDQKKLRDETARICRLKTIALADLLLRSAKSDVDILAARAAFQPGKPSNIKKKTTSSISGHATASVPQRLRLRIAVHEAGHALAHFILLGKSTIERVYISDDEGGVKTIPPGTITAENTRKFLIVLLAGRAAEELFYGGDRAGNGAGLDLSKATAFAYEAITELGFDKIFGLVSLAGFSQIKREIPPILLNLAIQRTYFWIKRSHTAARALLTKHQRVHVAITEALLNRDEMTGEEIAEIMHARRID